MCVVVVVVFFVVVVVLTLAIFYLTQPKPNEKKQGLLLTVRFFLQFASVLQTCLEIGRIRYYNDIKRILSSDTDIVLLQSAILQKECHQLAFWYFIHMCITLNIIWLCVAVVVCFCFVFVFLGRGFYSRHESTFLCNFKSQHGTLGLLGWRGLLEKAIHHFSLAYEYIRKPLFYV